MRDIKHNALAGRADQLTRFEDYPGLAPYWRDQVANLRLHESTRMRPIDRFEQERTRLRPLPAMAFDSDEVVPAVVSPLARIAFDGNRYSTPPQFVRKTITLRANRDELRLLHEGQVVAQHVRSYQRRDSCWCCRSIAWQRRFSSPASLSTGGGAGIRCLGAPGACVSPRPE